jgi:hypothetical protein
MGTYGSAVFVKYSYMPYGYDVVKENPIPSPILLDFNPGVQGGRLNSLIVGRVSGIDIPSVVIRVSSFACPRPAILFHRRDFYHDKIR